MLLVPTELRVSPIHGIGAFLLTPVKKGELIWHFDSRIDRVYSQSEVEQMPPLIQKFVDVYGCWHEASGLWLICGDNARHFNHSENPTTLSVGETFDDGDDVAAYDLEAGVELTSDYRVICDKSRLTGQLW